MTVATDVTCWKCATWTGNDVACHSCGNFQPYDIRIDYFRVMGIPVRLNLDQGQLRGRFYALSRALHPDNFAGRSPEEVAVATRNAAVLNQAYRTLREPMARAAYFLDHHGAKEYKAPPSLLMELMEAKELLDEVRGGSPEGWQRQELTESLDDFRGRVRRLDEELQGAFAAWDALGDDPAAEERARTLDRIRDNLGVRKYYANIVRDITEALGA